MEAAPDTCRDKIPKSAENLFLKPRKDKGG